MRPQVLVTRPPPGLDETVQALAAAGFAPIACPVMRIVPVPHDLPPFGEVGAILLTSRQALPALVQGMRDEPGLAALPLFAVGDRTARAAREARFTRVQSAGGDALSLAALVAGRMQPAAGGLPLLLPVGRGQGASLVAALGARGLPVRRVEVYAQQPETALAVPAEHALRDGTVEACLFFSAETARLFDDLCRPPVRATLAGVRALAISLAASRPLAALRWRSVEIASQPDAASLLALLEDRGTNPLEKTP